MNIMNKRIYRIILATGMLIVTSLQTSKAADSATPVPLSTAEITEQNLLGAWQCDSYLNGSIYQQDKFGPKWQLDPEGLFVVLENSQWTFAADGDGTYSVTTTAPNPIMYNSLAAVNSAYKVRGNQLMFKYSEIGTSHFYEIRPISESRINLYPLSDGFSPTLICQKQ